MSQNWSFFALRHHRSPEEYKRENGESVNQNARILWASIVSSLEVARYDWLPHGFFLTSQPPLFSIKIKKKGNFQLVFERVIL